MPMVRPGPAPGLEYGGFWIRLVGYLIDAIPIGILFGFLNLWTGTGFHCTNHVGAYVCSAGTGNLGTWLGFLALGVYWVLTWSLLGASLGQRALGLRVVNAATGGRIDLGRALLRYVGFVISAIPFTLGLIWAAFDPRKQGWHDKIAGTCVVRSVQ
ncbi:MAG: RDD family protein [Candidatus Dormibacteria bacterium]